MTSIKASVCPTKAFWTGESPVRLFYRVPAEIKKAGGDYVDAEVVVDGNLVTSRYPGDLPMFVSEMLKMLRKYHKER